MSPRFSRLLSSTALRLASFVVHGAEATIRRAHARLDTIVTSLDRIAHARIEAMDATVMRHERALMAMERSLDRRLDAEIDIITGSQSIQRRAQDARDAVSALVNRDA